MTQHPDPSHQPLEMASAHPLDDDLLEGVGPEQNTRAPFGAERPAIGPLPQASGGRQAPAKPLLKRPSTISALLVMISLTAYVGYDLARERSPHRIEGDLDVHEVESQSEAPAAPTKDVPMPAAPAPAPRLEVSVQAPAALAASEVEPNSASTPSEAASAPVEPIAVSVPPVEVEERVAALEAGLGAVLRSLQAQGYVKPGQTLTTLTAEALLPYPSAAPSSPSRSALAARSAARPRAAVVPSATPEPAPGVQVMAIDLWNGTPSVVVGTDVTGDTRIKVMQPGDVINGVALKSVDVAAREATFTAGGRDTTLPAAGL